VNLYLGGEYAGAGAVSSSTVPVSKEPIDHSSLIDASSAR